MEGRLLGCCPASLWGRWEEKPGSQACAHVCPPGRPPSSRCLLALLGEEVQSVTNRVIFITAVSGCGGGGEASGEGEGAEEQPQQLALQTRTCSAEACSPELALHRGSPAHGDPGPHPPALPAT